MHKNDQSEGIRDLPRQRGLEGPRFLEKRREAQRGETESQHIFSFQDFPQEAKKE